MTPQATTSGTSFDFTGIPSTAKIINVILQGVSLSGTDNLYIQLGDAGGLEVTGYASSYCTIGPPNSVVGAAATAAFSLGLGGTGSAATGTIQLNLVNSSTNTWVASGVVAADQPNAYGFIIYGSKSLSQTLTQVTITRSGSNTFDAGQVNVSYQ
jgi:hypothetical protein